MGQIIWIVAPVIVVMAIGVIIKTRHAPSPYPSQLPSETDEDYAKRLVIDGHKLQAVSRMRKATGMSIEEAAAWAEKVAKDAES